MIDCMILGDSIAVGVSAVRPECVSHSRSGWNSSRWNQDYLSAASSKSYKTIVISLGANDHAGVRTEAELRKMRESIKGSKVFWISPGQQRKPVAQAAIEKIAKEYGDTVLDRPQQQMSADGVHPTRQGYVTLAQATKSQD